MEILIIISIYLISIIGSWWVIYLASTTFMEVFPESNFGWIFIFTPIFNTVLFIFMGITVLIHRIFIYSFNIKKFPDFEKTSKKLFKKES